MNITDVGHLTSDADSGEDKMLKGAKREKKTVWEVAEFYTQAFERDIKKLNILFPDIFCKATEHIKEQIELVKKLEKKGFTYFAGGNVYFDVSKFKDYGKLARLDLSREGQARVDQDKNKRNKYDFGLWFTKSKFQDQEMKWKSPWGATGYPGWHVECSAMSMKYLGEKFDIHCGGMDLIPVHHTNEIAQSEAVTGKKWVNYWLHNEFVVMNSGKKMSKSSGEFITLAVLEEKGFSPLDYRYFCLGTHYRNPLMFSWEALEGAKNSFKKLVEKVLEFKDKGKVSKKYVSMFLKAINDDMNTPQALAVMWNLVNSKLSKGDKYVTLLEFDRVLGLGLEDVKKDKIPATVVKLAKERLKARLAKDWKKADLLRSQIEELGYVVSDSADGFEVKKS